MISIITSIHNQLGMNQLFYETLKRNTHNDFELIIIDNNSTDGSREYFENKAVVIRNTENYTYPYCQNQGIKVAQHKYLAFLNNDLLVSPDWDTKLIEIMTQEKLEIASVATNDRLESPSATRKISKRWKRVKKPLLFLFGSSYPVLKLMARWMYGNFNQFALSRYQNFGKKTMEGFSGSAIIMHTNTLDKIGLWDERIYAADFDIYLRSKQRSIEYNDIRPIHIALGIYFHHYQRLTIKSKYQPFANAHLGINISDKWQGKEFELLNDIDC